MAQVDGVKEEERLDRERSGMSGVGAVLVSAPSHTSRRFVVSRNPQSLKLYYAYKVTQTYPLTPCHHGQPLNEMFGRFSDGRRSLFNVRLGDPLKDI